jgi:hypothetical protein
MTRCAWEFIPRQGTLKGIDICTLTGRACLINNSKDRPKCSRAAQIRAFQAKHYPNGAAVLPSPEPGIQAELHI